MRENKAKFGLGIGIGVIAIFLIGGLIVYSFLSSPEVKLANGLQNLLNEDRVQVESEFDLSYDFDFDELLNDPYMSEMDEFAFNLVEDLFNSLSGTSSIIYDKELDVMELSGTYGISGDISGEDISLHIPISMYFSGEEDVMAIDLDPYAQFIPDAIDVISYNILPNIEEVQEELELITDGEDVGDFFSRELNDLLQPTIDSLLTGKQFSDTLDLDRDRLFTQLEDNERYVLEFVFEKMIEYLDEHNEEELITEEDGWIYVNLDDQLLLQSILYAFEEAKEDEDTLAALEEELDTSIDTAISNIEEFQEDISEMTFDFNIGFLIERGQIVQSITTSTFSFEEDGVSFTGSSTVNSDYLYGDQAAFSFYDAERDELSEADMEQYFYDLEMQIESRLEDIYADLYADMYYFEDEFDWDAEWDEDYELDWDYDEYYEYELTEEELELIESIESQSVSHEDFDITEEEMYYWVLDLEIEGFVEFGTADYYFPE
ncbi:hypothetical protein [Halalkalibacter hemicellulosilyticus]|uniref:Uncharacterized protein n=1 Tax=Halalkalibacter hemicellulosilyticusJCM 9152 TaxID=1236971 RepID=W4QG51_9BACI|nr:hypothetical protein [Halalkalibacter hemicellulosilyticus]GAE31056.1 hypothetical protein JCM9152_2494 [Halalkalibacter hemicellulosilyticusJCM 9152]